VWPFSNRVLLVVSMGMLYLFACVTAIGIIYGLGFLVGVVFGVLIGIPVHVQETVLGHYFGFFVSCSAVLLGLSFGFMDAPCD